MNMNNDKTVEVLNTLVVINNDRIHGYKTASENAEERDLKTLFSKFEQTSYKCRQDLIREIDKIGGKAEGGTKVSGKFYRALMDVKSALTGNDRKAILTSCEYGEEKALKTYKDVLDDDSEYLSHDQQKMIKSQYGLIKNDKSDIRKLQNSLELTS
jgi:uncharacterized protein (TIGR02284 family)